MYFKVWKLTLPKTLAGGKYVFFDMQPKKGPKSPDFLVKKKLKSD